MLLLPMPKSHVWGFSTALTLQMCYVASYLLAALRVNASSSTKDIKEILDSISIKAEEDQLNKDISELKGRTSMSLTRLLASWPAVAFSTTPGVCSSCCWFCRNNSTGEERWEEGVGGVTWRHEIWLVQLESCYWAGGGGNLTDFEDRGLNSRYWQG